MTTVTFVVDRAVTRIEDMPPRSEKKYSFGWVGDDDIYHEMIYVLKHGPNWGKPIATEEYEMVSKRDHIEAIHPGVLFEREI